MLFLDIEGHRQADGSFDTEMRELQHDFVLGVLALYLLLVEVFGMSVELHPLGAR
jgi:hypothetical protein